MKKWNGGDSEIIQAWASGEYKKPSAIVIRWIEIPTKPIRRGGGNIKMG